MKTFAAAMARLMAQRRALKERLAEAMRALQGGDSGAAAAPGGLAQPPLLSRAAGHDAVEEAVAELRASMLREHRVRMTFAW